MATPEKASPRWAETETEFPKSNKPPRPMFLTQIDTLHLTSQPPLRHCAALPTHTPSSRPPSTHSRAMPGLAQLLSPLPHPPTTTFHPKYRPPLSPPQNTQHSLASRLHTPHTQPPLAGLGLKQIICLREWTAFRWLPAGSCRV